MPRTVNVRLEDQDPAQTARSRGFVRCGHEGCARTTAMPGAVPVRQLGPNAAVAAHPQTGHVL
jgi:hypothetical protein